MAAAETGLLNLVIVTPGGSVTKTEVTEVQAPGVRGEFGVLPGHIPFLSAIGAGVLTYVEAGRPRSSPWAPATSRSGPARTSSS
jgi:F0F1-type ATP synthase epsilon subunit